MKSLPQAKLSRKTDYCLRAQFLRISMQNSFNGGIKVFCTFKTAKFFVLPAVFLIVVISVPCYAYGSDDVTRGSLLYPVKKNLERVEYNMANTPEKKFNKCAKFVNRRLAESDRLSKKGIEHNSDLAETINDIMRLTANADRIATSNSFDDKKKMEIEERMNKIKKNQFEAMEKISKIWNVNANGELQDSLAIMIDDLKKDSQIKLLGENGFPVVQIATSTDIYDTYKNAFVSATSSGGASSSNVKRSQEEEKKTKMKKINEIDEAIKIDFVPIDIDNEDYRGREKYR